MSRYEVIVTDEDEIVGGTFDCTENALIFVQALFDKYHDDPNMELRIVRKVKQHASDRD